MDPITLCSIFTIGSKLIDRLIPDPAQKAAAQMEFLKMQQSGDLAALAAETDLAKGQLAVNAVEAASPDIFVAGWRPFIGWVCGAAFAWNWIGLPVAKLALALSNHPIDMVAADMSEMLPVLLGMLGLGGLRTIEKVRGVAGKQVS